MTQQKIETQNQTEDKIKTIYQSLLLIIAYLEFLVVQQYS